MSFFGSLFGTDDANSGVRKGLKAFNTGVSNVYGATAPYTGAGGAATGQLSDLLGLNGGDAANSANDVWRKSDAYKTAIDSGGDAITKAAAGAGLLGSGATLKGLTTFGQDTANKFRSQYAQQLGGLGGMGLQGAGINAQAELGRAGAQLQGQSQIGANNQAAATQGLGLIGRAIGGATSWLEF